MKKTAAGAEADLVTTLTTPTSPPDTHCRDFESVRSRHVRQGRPRPADRDDAALASAGMSVLLSGPPFFAERESAVAGTAARAVTLDDNGAQRLAEGRRAGEVLPEWPLSGAGFHFASSAAELVTTRRLGGNTASAHNGFLKAAADGGLLLILPLWGAVVILLVLVARRLPAALRAGQHAQVASAVVLLVLSLSAVAAWGGGMDLNVPVSRS